VRIICKFATVGSVETSERQWNFHRTGEYHFVGAIYLHSLLFSNENMAEQKINLHGYRISFVFRWSPKTRVKLWKATGCPYLVKKKF
jgi:hypothetical protein